MRADTHATPLVTRGDIVDLITSPAGYPSISLYVPTVVAGSDQQQNSIRYRTALHGVRDRLAKNGKPFSKDVLAHFEEAEALLADASFWNHQAGGLAVFIGSSTFRHFRLPVSVEEQVEVNDRFVVKPLLATLSLGQTFWVLALSQKNTRLYRADRFTMEEVAVPNMPKSLDEVIGGQEHERQQQMPATSVGRRDAPGGMISAMRAYYNPKEARKQEVVDMFRAIDHAVKPVFSQSKLPLVVAGLEYYLPLYEEATHYENLLTSVSVGSVDRMSHRTLHQKVVEAVEPILQAEVQAKLQRFRELEGVGSNRAVSGVEEVLHDVEVGKVGELFVAADREEPGMYGEGVVTRSGKRIPGMHDLLDIAASEAFRQGADVYVLPADQLPEGREAVAVLRY